MKNNAAEQSREYWMIYIWPGFLAVVWFGSTPTSSPHFPTTSCLSFSVILCIAGRDYWREGGETKSYNGEKAWPSLNHSILSVLQEAVLRIHDILVWIRIRGSMPSRCPQKTNLKKSFSAYYFLKVLLQVSKIKVKKKSRNSRNQDLSCYFCLMIEGSGSGSRLMNPDPDPGDPKTCGSGSRFGSATLSGREQCIWQS